MKKCFVVSNPAGIHCPSSPMNNASLVIEGPLHPERDLRVCQGPDEKEGQGGRVQETGRSGPPLLRWMSGW